MVKLCVDCNADISHKGNKSLRCDSCLGPGYLMALERRKAKQKAQRSGKWHHYADKNGFYFKCTKEFILHQSIDSKGNFLIPLGFTTKRMEMVCNDCKRSEMEIRGNWAPIYSESNSKGQELNYILLCWNCYLKRCEAS